MKNVIGKKIIIIAMVLGIGAYVWHVSRSAQVVLKNPSAEGSTAASASDSVIVMEPRTIQISPESRKYKNVLFRFEVIYPKDLSVKEYDDGTSASTITFENAAGDKGFQIFIVPYQEKQISAERFKRDNPSGVMEQPTNVIIGGTRGTMFFGKNMAMGDTAEVWFIKNGFLYEITTYKTLDAWLADIMQTWRFDT